MGVGPGTAIGIIITKGAVPCLGWRPPGLKFGVTPEVGATISIGPMVPRIMVLGPEGVDPEAVTRTILRGRGLFSCQDADPHLNKTHLLTSKYLKKNLIVQLFIEGTHTILNYRSTLLR